MSDQFDKIRQWGIDRQFLTDATVSGQVAKLHEELGELCKALLENDYEEIKDGIGDCVVVLTQIAMLKAMSIEDCIHTAYEEIKGRKGMMIKGEYVKYKDLTPEQQAELDKRIGA